MAKKISRVKTGINGFDKLVEGGFPKNSSILVCGGPGCGKTIFACEYIYNGAKKYNEKGMYVSFEQKAESIRNQGEQFGWDIPSMEKSGKIKLLSIPASTLKRKTIEDIIATVKKEKIKRLVLDSLSTLVINAPIYTSPAELSVQDVVGGDVIFSPPVIGDYVAKRFIYQLIESLRDLDCTTILIGESGDENYISRDTISEFACDGVIIIRFDSLGGDYSRTLLVRKMRGTKNDQDIHPLEISSNGLAVHSLE